MKVRWGVRFVVMLGISGSLGMTPAYGYSQGGSVPGHTVSERWTDTADVAGTVDAEADIAADISADGTADANPDILDGWKDLDRFLQKKQQVSGAESFSQLVRTLKGGDAGDAVHLLLSMLMDSLAGEIRSGGHLAGQLLAIGIIGAVFARFSELFSESQISETGFFMTYLLAFTVLAAAFSDSVRIAVEVLGRQAEFMKVLLPSYLLAAVWAGSSVASAAWYEFVLFLIGTVQYLYLKLLAPLIRVYILLVLAGNMAREELLSHLTGMLKSGIVWGTRSLVGLVLGFQLIQGMVLPYADAVKSAGVQKLLSVIPGVGQGAGAVTKMILGSGVLIKNSMGAAAVVILLLISLVPLVKLFVLIVLYRSVAAMLEPVADRRLVSCISGIADGQKLLLGLAASGMLLFIITIALICAGTNAAYLA